MENSENNIRPVKYIGIGLGIAGVFACLLTAFLQVQYALPSGFGVPMIWGS